MQRLSLYMALALPVCAFAIDIPRLGFVRDAQGNVRAVDGVSGNFLVGDAGADSTEAFAWNGSFGIRKTASAIEWWDASGNAASSFAATPGRAVIGFDRSSAWLFCGGVLEEVTARGLRPVDARFAADEVVLAIAGAGPTVSVAVRGREGNFVVSFDRASGARLGQISIRPATAVVFLGDGTILGADAHSIWLARPDGSSATLPTNAATTGLEWMGRDWLHISSRNGEFALRVLPGADPVLYQLPATVRTDEAVAQ